MKNKGFTLIELLIVIGIIAILASAVIVAINPGQQFEQARNSTRRSHLSTVASAMYSYSVTEQGNFPPCVTDTWSNVTDCTELTTDFINQFPDPPQDEETYEVRESNGQLEFRSDGNTDGFDDVIVQ